MTDPDFLKRVRYLIRKPQLWCRDRYTKNGRYCLAGAAIKVAGGFHKAANETGYMVDTAGGEARLSKLLERTAVYGLSRFNDESTHRQVIARLDAAIKKAEEGL